MLGMQNFLLHQTVPTTLVAVHEGEPVGSAALVECDMDDRREWTPWLASVYIDEAWRNKGLATKLIGAIEQLARKAGFEKIWLYTEDAQNLYRKLGWETVETRLYKNQPVECMSKILN